MRILALDTTTARGSIAVLAGDDLAGELRLASPRGHSERVLPGIDFLLGQLDLRARDIDGFVVATGPGSFTGLRVGISAVQGLALALERPCLGIPALDALAARIRGAAPCLVAVMEASRGDVFAGLYDADARLQGSLLVEPPEALLERVPERAAFLGDGVERHRELIRQRRPDALFPERSLFLAGTLARLAAPRFRAGEGAGPETLRPVYLREAHIRKPAS